MDRSRAFYLDILGFKEADWGRTSLPVSHEMAPLSISAEVHRESWYLGLGWVRRRHFRVAPAAQIKRSGDPSSPVNHSWALEMQIEDPDGHILRFGTDPDSTKPFLD